MLPTEKFYAACEIYSHPEVKACPARLADPDKGIKYRPARRAHPPRRGLLPIHRTQFERLRKAGKFPAPDAALGDRPMWTGKVLNDFLMKREASK